MTHKATRRRGRPSGVPINRRRAIEAAILEALPIALWEPGRPRPARAYPRGWTRPNFRKVVSDAQKMLAAVGAPVSRRTIERALRNERPYQGVIPRDARAAGDDGRASMLIRHAADFLSGQDGAQRDAIVDAIYAWCVARSRSGGDFPRSPFALALAYRIAASEKRATK